MQAKAGIHKAVDFPGFRVALAIASLPGMTIDYVTNFRDTTQANSLQSQFRQYFSQEAKIRHLVDRYFFL
jgi:hypothetical protein